MQVIVAGFLTFNTLLQALQKSKQGRVNYYYSVNKIGVFLILI